MAISENAEAGPSRPRQSSETIPVPATPPPTTTAKHVKRRSWFGLGSPVTTPSAKKEKERRRSSIIAAEEVELSSVPIHHGSPAAPPAEIDAGLKEAARAGEEELLTIDGDPEQTVKKKKKRRSKGQSGGAGGEDDFEVMRMSDLGGKTSSSSRAQSESVSDETVLAGDAVKPDQPTPAPFTPRTFARVASDREPFTPPSAFPHSLPDPHETPRSSAVTPPTTVHSQTRPTISPRTSSITSAQLAPLQIDKSLPAIKHDYDRPLPPLPASPPARHTPRMPHGIVVTPSSPNQSTHPRSSTQTPRTERRSRSAGGRSRESSEFRRVQSSAPSAPIGLGLPTSLLPPSAIDEPPPVPSKPSSKPQSVSSPLPSRSPSPIPKISFVAPDEPPPERDRGRQQDTSKKTVKRARSLSIIFGKSPSNVEKPGFNEATPPESIAAPTESGPPGVTKSQGVLEWLGVRKSVKRRNSEAKLKESNHQTQGQGVTSLSTEDVALSDGEKSRSRESLAGSETVDGHTQQTPRRPEMRTASSTITVVPQGTPGKLASLFTRRASAKANEDEPDLAPPLPVPIPVGPRSIPNANQRNATASTASSQSSLVLPSVDPVSPFVPDGAPWVSSPGTRGEEEVLFSPEGGSNWGPGVRPWMDGSEVRNSSRSSLSSPLSSLPEQTITPDQPALLPPPSAREGRVRSWSDAPLPPSMSNHGRPHSPASPGIQGMSRSLQPSPQTLVRPSLGSRSNSGNSAIIGRMKSVFSKSTGRSRSNSLLRQSSSSDIDEFGGLQGSQRMRPSTSSSSVTSSNMGRRLSPGGSLPPGNLLSLNDSPRTSLDRSPRTSFAPSISSVTSGSTRQSVGFDIPQEPSNKSAATARKSRVRASTISLAPTSYHFAPPSPNIFPAAATPPRRRPGTIHRLSTGLFGSGPSSPRGSGSLFPLPPRSSGSISSVTTAGAPWDEQAVGTGLLSPGTSPRPSTGSIPPLTSAAIKQISAREGDESPKQWLERVVTGVGRHDIAGVLAASADEFHSKALQLYMETFDFTHNALDVALRRLLLDMSLPKETQQIDRVIEAFAARYEQCEPGLFRQKDNTYVLAFSMMMLHTDAFNKHNKNKMTKADYVRNTRLDGVPPLVLEAFFDNITFTPFVFIEDDLDLRRSSGYETSSSVFGSSTPSSSGMGVTNGPLPPPKTSKIDVYHMIVRGLLASLRVDVEHQIPVETPYSALGTRPFLDMDGLHRAFANAHGLLIPAPPRKLPGKLTTPARRGAVPEGDNEMVLRVTKVGLLSRKDDGGESGKKASRKWKSWSVILTGSQILFFKDPVWALTLLEQARSADGDAGRQLLLPRMTTFKPDEVFPMKDCIALFDRMFTAYPNTFRFIMPGGQQYLMQASDEFEMNEWITLINYASAFKSAAVKMRGSGMRKDQAALAGAAAAASHRRQLQGGDSQVSLASGGRKAVFGEPDPDAANDLASAPSGGIQPDPKSFDAVSEGARQQHQTLAKHGQVVDIDAANEVVHEGEQLEEVFGVVKAELAAGRGGAPTISHPVSTATSQQTSSQVSQQTLAAGQKGHTRTTSRVETIQNQISTFKHRSSALENSLLSSLLLARNLAILTAFQKSTRDRISSSIPPLAQKVRTERIQLSKLRLWLKVLEHEAGVEEREFARVRHVALQAAAKSLKGTVGDVVKDLNEEGQGPAVPVLALPDEAGGGEKDSEGGDEEEDADLEQGVEDDRHDRGNQVTSPGELPVNFARTSDELPPRTSSRQATLQVSSTLLAPEVQLSENGKSPTSEHDTTQPHGQGQGQSEGQFDRGDEERSGPDDQDRSGHSTPMMIFPMESPLGLGLPSTSITQDIDATPRKSKEHPASKTRSTSPRDGIRKDEGQAEVHGQEQEQEQEREEAEDWHTTRAARRVSLVRAGEKGEWERMKMTSKASLQNSASPMPMVE